MTHHCSEISVQFIYNLAGCMMQNGRQWISNCENIATTVFSKTVPDHLRPTKKFDTFQLWKVRHGLKNRLLLIRIKR